MTTFLVVRGMDDVAIAESFNSARKRVNRALTGADTQGKELPAAKSAQPLHDLSFKTVDEDGVIDGRFAVTPDNLIGVGSDEIKDQGSSDDDDE